VTTCTLTYSASLVRRAVHTYFWRKFASPLGAFFLLSLVLMTAAVWFVWSTSGPNWFVGMFGFVLYMNVLFQVMGYFFVPRVFARAAEDPSTRIAEVETSAQGIRISRGGNTMTTPWVRFTKIWLYDDFVVLVRKPAVSLMQFVVLPSDGMSSQMRVDLIAASQGKPSGIT
jgi:hypothetical protein